MKHAKYIGTSTIRRISALDWRVAGVNNQDTVTWSKVNGHSVAQDQLSEQAWAKLSEDPGFVFVDDDGSAAEVHEAAVQAAVGRMRARSAATAFVPASAPEVTSVDVSED